MTKLQMPAAGMANRDTYVSALAKELGVKARRFVGITALAAPTQANLHSRELTYFLPLAI